MTTSDYTDYRSIDDVFQSPGRYIDPSTGEICEENTITESEGGPRSQAGGDSLSGGLSSGHICTWVGGHYVKVSTSIQSTSVGGGKRGKVKGFSLKSRRRLMVKIAQTKKAILPLFVTLTYPGVYSEDPRIWKRDLRVFWMRFKRSFPCASAIWKLEFQKRGAPHYHLLIWGVEYAHALFRVPGMWFEVVGSGDEKHFRVGTRVEVVRSFRGVMAYASKYLGKLDSVPSDEPGRFWGVMSAEFIPWADMVDITITDRDAFQFIRMLRRLIHAKSRAYKSLSAFTDGEFWFDRIDRLLLSFS